MRERTERERKAREEAEKKRKAEQARRAAEEERRRKILQAWEVKRMESGKLWYVNSITEEGSWHCPAGFAIPPADQKWAWEKEEERKEEERRKKAEAEKKAREERERREGEATKEREERHAKEISLRTDVLDDARNPRSCVFSFSFFFNLFFRHFRAVGGFFFVREGQNQVV